MTHDGCDGLSGYRRHARAHCIYIYLRTRDTAISCKLVTSDMVPDLAVRGHTHTILWPGQTPPRFNEVI